MESLLVDYEFCYGCHACEMACKTAHAFGEGECGIQVIQLGPRPIGDGRWEFSFVPIPTDLCDMCSERQEAGKMPTCVHHCNAKVIEWGSVEELSQRASTKAKMALYTRG